MTDMRYTVSQPGVTERVYGAIVPYTAGRCNVTKAVVSKAGIMAEQHLSPQTTKIMNSKQIETMEIVKQRCVFKHDTVSASPALWSCYTTDRFTYLHRSHRALDKPAS